MERKQFLEQRRRGVGASDIAAILGLCPYRTALHVYLDKIGELPPSLQAPSEAAAIGLHLEPAIAELFTQRTGIAVRPPDRPTYSMPWYPWVLASPDRLAVDNDGQTVPVEIKNVGEHHLRDWGEEGSDDIPSYYAVQVQQQMLVLGAANAYVAALLGGSRFRWYKLTANRTVQQRILDAATDFWGCVESRCPPEPNWKHSQTGRLLRELYQKTTENLPVPPAPVEIQEDTADLCRRYDVLRSARLAIERQEEELKTRIAGAIGLAPEAVGSGYRITRKRVTVPEKVIKGYEYVRIHISRTDGGDLRELDRRYDDTDGAVAELLGSTGCLGAIGQSLAQDVCRRSPDGSCSSGAPSLDSVPAESKPHEV